jgi:hypothetical protein
MTIIRRIYEGYCIAFGVYGISRGMRVEDAKFWTEKAISGFLVGCVYATPVFNIFPTIRLINRLESEYRGKSPRTTKLFKERLEYYDEANYEEITGFCYDTI